MNTLYTYIPQDRLQALARGESLPDFTSGSALFADISGFTSLARAFAETLGPKRGAEALLGVLNPLFDALIEPVHQYGGSVIGFVGDAITCWFNSPSLQSEQPLYHSSLRATVAALAMQLAIKPFATVQTPDGSSVALSIKVAISSGTARRFVVGDPAIQRIDTVAGATLSRMAETEKHAGQGEVVVSREVAENLGDVLDVSAWRGKKKYAVVGGLKIAVQPAPWPPLPENALNEDQARPWILPSIFEQLRSGVGSLGDLRPVTPLMVQFGGIDFDIDDGAGDKLDAFVSWAQRIVHHHGGSFLQLTIGDKGAFMYAAFGAPLAHENDPARALQAALSMRNVPANQATYLTPLRIGLTRGTAWTGNYGGYGRFTYGVISSDVNLSARLMGRAEPGQILVSERMGRYPGFRFEHIGDLVYKGFETPLPTYSLLGEQVEDRRIFQTAMVGREAKLEYLETFAQPLFQNRLSGVAIIYGEPGIGKSRLAYALQQMLGERVSWFTGQTDQILHQAFNPFVHWLKRYFNQSSDATPEQNKANFEGRLNQVGDNLHSLIVEPRSSSLNLQEELIRTRSFLGALLGLYWSNSLYAQLTDPKLRYENTINAIKSLLLVESQLRPVVFELEDGHWLDEPSREMLLVLSRNVTAYPLLILITSRYNDDGSQPVFSLDPEMPTLKLDLETLTHEALEKQAVTLLGGRISSALMTLLWERSRANPFFAEQMLLHFRETGALIQTPTGEWAVKAMPITLSADMHTMLVARIDRLAHQVRQVVQAAAVLGFEFDVQLLSKMLRTDTLPEVREAEQGQIWDLLSELRYIFKHALLRDAAYDMQLHSRLRELHHLAAMTAEHVYADQLPAYYDLLAYHYKTAYQLGVEAAVERTRHYLLKAGEAAQKNFANDTALDYYSQLLPMLNATAEKAQVYLQRGAVLELTGKLSEAESDYRAALVLEGAGTAVQANAQLALGKLSQRYDDNEHYEQSLVWLEQAYATWSALQDQPGMGRALIEIGYTFWLKGNYPDAKRYLEEGLTWARKYNNKSDMAQALNNLGNVAWSQEDYTVAREYYTESLELRRELADKQGIAVLLFNLGNIPGDLPAARGLFEESLALRRELGDKWGIAYSLNNLGVVAHYQEDYGGARAFYEECLTLMRELGIKLGIMAALINLGNLALMQSDYDAAHRYYAENLKLPQDSVNIHLIYGFAGVAAVRQKTGHASDAVRLASVSETLLLAANLTREASESKIFNDAVSAARVQLGEEAFNSTWAEGEKMTIEEAIELALLDVA